SLTGVNTAASISAPKLSNGPTRAITSSGTPFAVIAASRLSASKIQIAPSCPPANNLVAITQTRTNPRRSLFIEVPAWPAEAESDIVSDGGRGSTVGRVQGGLNTHSLRELNALLHIRRLKPHSA